MNEYNMGGLIPDPQFNLNEQLNKLEDRIAELENAKPETKPEPDANWRGRWEPEDMVYLESEIESEKEIEMLNRKAGPYIRQLQWLYEHYPEQNGEWGEDTRTIVRCDKDTGEFSVARFDHLLPINAVFMSQKAAIHLRNDLNSGKVRFHD